MRRPTNAGRTLPRPQSSLLVFENLAQQVLVALVLSHEVAPHMTCRGTYRGSVFEGRVDWLGVAVPVPVRAREPPA